MRVLGNVKFMQANPQNFAPSTRKENSIKYIVLHYTSNTGDTALNNVKYFRDTVTKSSAHYFVSDDSIYQSVPITRAAYSVGLGSMKEPYFKYPTMWKIINNTNSISIEMCGSKQGPEASEKTKETTAKLVADLLEKLNLTPARVYRHYDVTGKPCPKWAVDDEMKWLEMRLLINKEFYGKGDDDEVLKDTPENYSMFKLFMERYEQDKAAAPADWERAEMEAVKARGLMDGTRPKSGVTRGELATVLNRLDGLHK